MNFILILLDDLGWNDVGIHNPKVHTPNINNLSNEGCELLRNYTFPICAPTRAMMQTGIYAYKCGMQRLYDPWQDFGLDKNIKILPQYLKELDYKTFALGKWHLGHNRKFHLPHNRGYDYHYGNMTGCVHHYAHHHGNGGRVPEAQIHDFSENGKPVYPKGHFCDIITDKTLDIIEQNKYSKFFIYLAYNSPHVPLECPQEFKDLYDTPNPKKSYYGMITHLDFNIGKIISKLKSSNLYEDTTIWIQSDNGGWLISWAGGDNEPLKNGKTSFYEGGVRTFSIIKNNQIKIKKFDGFVHCTDILPTVLDFCDIQVCLDGQSIKSNLLKNTNEPRDIVLSFYNEKFWCFLFGEIKIINQNNNIECFNVIEDPFEKTDIKNKIYEIYKNKVNLLISKCSSERVNEYYCQYSKEDIAEKCKKVKYWGQQNKPIKILSKKLMKTESKNFLELSGYDKFYVDSN